MQLNKYIAHCGFTSRRNAEEFVRSGRVSVNGKIIREPGFRVETEKDNVCIDGEKIHLKNRHKYIILNKPGGFLTTSKDDFGRKTVVDLIGAESRVFPVGRLDRDTTGILLLTDDGELAHRLTHPRYKVEKTYRAWVKGNPARGNIERFKTGVILDDGDRVKGDARVIKNRQDRSLLEITVHQGKKRQIKRMCKAIGHPVQQLNRIKFGDLTVDGMAEGEWRELTRHEIKKLYDRVGLK